MRIFAIDELLLTEAINVLGENEFSKAIKFCRLNPVSSPKDRRLLINDLMDSAYEENQANKFESVDGTECVDIVDVHDVKINSTTLYKEFIHWAMVNKIFFSIDLRENEISFFDCFSDLSDSQCSKCFNHLALYLDMRESSPMWPIINDPNNSAWLKMVKE